MNHAPLKKLRQIQNTNLFPPLTAPSIPDNMVITFSAYAHGNSTTELHTTIFRPQTPIGYTISSNTSGPITPKCKTGHRHILTFIDIKARFATSIPLYSLLELPSSIRHTIQNIQQRTNLLFRRYQSKMPVRF